MAFQLKDFAFATVMDVSVFPDGTQFLAAQNGDIIPVAASFEGVPTAQDAVLAIAELDSLTMSNITQEGPQKETRGGTAAEPIIRFRKTVRLEMEDVVITPTAMRALFGATLYDENGTRIDPETYVAGTPIGGFGITDTFAKMLTLRGKTFVIDRETGDRRWIDITFKRFLPDSVLDMMMEAEGDLGIVNVAGELFPDGCGEYFTVGRIVSPECSDEDETPPTTTTPDPNL
jgi:hypothetical protein